MFSWLKNWQRERQLRQLLRPFWQEVSKNLELFYVMDQRQVIEKTFPLEAWQQANSLSKVEFSEPVRRYAKDVETYNETFRDFKEFEKWYAADMKNKTRDNAKQLHAKKTAVQQQFKALRPVLEQAKDHLTQRLLALGVLK